MPLGPSLTLFRPSSNPETHQIPAKPDHSSGISAVSRHAGAETSGLGELLKTKQLRKMVDSYNGGNKSFEAMYRSGESELAIVQLGDLPLRNKADGTPGQSSRPKNVRVFNGKSELLEHADDGDCAYVKAYKAYGVFFFWLAIDILNGVMGRDAKMALLEDEQMVKSGGVRADTLRLVGVFFKCLIREIEDCTSAKKETEVQAQRQVSGVAGN
ncbi:hypothetical protein E4U34_006406 [Claviceps purpurea]|nr:hypothetical protein E4U34_006406 [Claviceps purpurea]